MALAYAGRFEATDPAKTKPLVTATGAWEVSLLGIAAVHKIFPESVSKGARAPAIVVWIEGARVKFCWSPLAMFVYTLLPSVAAPRIPHVPKIPPLELQQAIF
ncbi:hypothetical protein ACFX1S_021290 [Malus domestica]